MKIGILTLLPRENYGGILQAGALYQFLSQQGHDVVLLYKTRDTSSPDWVSACKTAAKQMLRVIPFHDYKNIRSNASKRRELARRTAFHRPFVESIIPNISEALYSKNDLKAFTERERLDAIIVGSDQVWRKQYIDDRHYLCYFLDFIDGTSCKKIAYAASFGSNHWEGKGDEEAIGALLADFTAVSVREKSAVDICRKTFGYAGATQLLDPTLLVDRDYYVGHVIGNHRAGNELSRGLVTYVLDEGEEKSEIIRQVMLSKGFQDVTHLKAFDKTAGIRTVPDWVASLRNADFVVTDSFHGMVFSIIFEKDFIVIGNSTRGMERFTSLLSQLRLEDRLVLNRNDLRPEAFASIDYNAVNETLLPLKQHSWDFLLNALDGKR